MAYRAPAHGTFVVFNSNVAFVDGLKLVEIVEQARCSVSRESSTDEPLLPKLLDGIVAALRDLVIGFQRLNLCEG
ncbi:MAG TPA: hypothetical protein VGF13_10685, partial [Verrucomicrobiae bacterium]